ncbi:TonB-dependent receptor [Altererythrobacter sp. B11]|uniref:TonB-dependent receptor domain-containing protein n=1 Tax=Altererythrobacter sp. B11 TaxID=2060312 RepID=UPI000DC726D7|nr:TonB-dependent receptor [Altererythrobacter sp. B11]BBC74178.1 TonB-dependent receptor [Altererythrobacter sp. B11]
MKTISIRKCMLAGAGLPAIALLGAGAFAAPAYAQDVPCDPATEADCPPTGEAIIVTGSRIASPTVESAAPLQIIDSGQIENAGVTNIQELLLENPVFGTPALSRTNSAFLTSGTGVATVDLRDLGSDRTLVLINGRRVVASVANSSIVDLNVIPTQFIDRVDVLTGGASSLYGSDAVAGVVNFVYKKDFEGIEANAQYGITEEGDDERYQANVTAGTNFSDDRGNIMVHFGYSKEKGVLSRQRSNTYTDDTSLMALTGDPADWGVSEAPFYSSFAPGGTFFSGDYAFTYGPDGALQPCTATNGTSCTSDLGTGSGPTGFNRQYYRTIAVPVERYLFAASGDYELTNNLNFFFEGTYNRTSSSRIIEPFALASDGSTGIYPSSGVMPIENYATGDFNDDGILERQLFVNPVVPGAIAAQATDTDGDGLRDIGFSRRLVEFGPRSGSTDRDFYRFVVGFDGTLLEDRFRWDVSYNFGQVKENQVSNGQVNVVNFRDALAVRQDVLDENGNGSTDDSICINAEARANGCVPINIFGAGNISQAAIDYITAQGTYQTSIKQQVLQGNISGALFDLPAGPLGLALGVEYRSEDSYSDNDALTNAGLNAGNKLPDTAGSFDVLEGYAEVKVPILADMSFFELLEVGGAVRVADYSTVGTVTSWNVTGTWMPVSDLRIRGTYARSVRAPNIGELYAGLSQTFPSGLTDPCEGIGATGGGALGDNCRAAPGVAANIAANGEFTLSQSDIQGISGFNGGNPNLNEETATSWTVGAVINPRSLGLGNATLTVDYFNYKIDDVIASFGRQFSLAQCYGEGNSTFCDLITRRPSATATNSSGSIEFINALSVNAAVLKTQGLDVVGTYSTSVGMMSGDRLALRGSYTHLFEYDYFQLEGAPADPQDGEIGTAADRFTANAAYSTDNFKVSFTGTFIGKSYEDDQFCIAYDLDPKCVSVPAQFYLDMQSSVYVNRAVEVYFGIDNLLDNSAPNILSNTTFNTTGTDTAADVYDPFGRRFYTGVRLKF